MRGRNDGAQKKRLAFLVCLMLVALFVICIYYGSFIKSALKHKRESSFVEGYEELVFRRHKNVVQDKQDLNMKAEDDKDGAMISWKKQSTVDDIVSIKVFPVCDSRHSELIPCLDRHQHSQLKLKLNLSLMEHYERHCPPPHRRLNCLIPPPPNYKVPIHWPASRDEVWRSNVPHTFLAMEKSDQHWMIVKDDKVNFPGGGTHFHDGADKYITSLGKMLKYPHGDLSNHGKLRTVLDVGCGVASFGAYLLPLDILAMSLAPNDVHENQIQFALERGIPSTLGVLGTKRLPFPSKSFDLVHCSRCRIDWLQRDGILLLEVDRLLRPGGFFAWSSPPAYRDDAEDVQIWNNMSDLVKRMCWSIAAKEGQTVIWKRALTNDCHNRRPQGIQPPLCNLDDDPDAAWDKPMKACLSRLPERRDVGKRIELPPWPRRLIYTPVRLETLGFSEKHYRTDKIAWRSRVEFYFKQLTKVVEEHTIRNVMDMKAHFGGFAAALKERPIWVMNVVPTLGLNTLTVVYDCGLIGSLHNWCEAFSTYPRTYDLLHAWTIFSDIEKQGCSMEDLLLEMDRILRPLGFVVIRDKGVLVDQIHSYISALHWDAWSLMVKAVSDDISTSDDEKVLFARKQFWKPEDDDDDPL